MFAMIPVVACGLICDMKDLDLAKETKQTVTSKHNEPILTGCYNNHWLSIGSKLVIFQHCSQTLILIIVINNSKVCL